MYRSTGFMLFRENNRASILPAGAAALALWLGLLAAGGAGCDSAGPVETGDVQATGPIEDVSLYLAGGYLHVDLEAQFVQTAGLPLSFSTWATPKEPDDIVRVHILGSTVHVLRVETASIGQATVAVAASDDYGHADTLRFRVTVLDDCPVPPQDGYVDYFPLEVGRTEEYDYSVYAYCMGDRTWRYGILRREVVEGGACLHGAVTYTVRQDLSGTWRWRPSYANDESHDQTGMMDESLTATYLVTDGIAGFGIGTPENPTPRWYPPGTPDTVRTIRMEDNGSIELNLVAGEGLVYWSHVRRAGASCRETTTLTRR